MNIIMHTFNPYGFEFLTRCDSRYLWRFVTGMYSFKLKAGLNRMGFAIKIGIFV